MCARVCARVCMRVYVSLSLSLSLNLTLSFSLSLSLTLGLSRSLSLSLGLSVIDFRFSLIFMSSRQSQEHPEAARAAKTSRCLTCAKLFSTSVRV